MDLVYNKMESSPQYFRKVTKNLRAVQESHKILEEEMHQKTIVPPIAQSISNDTLPKFCLKLKKKSILIYRVLKIVYNFERSFIQIQRCIEIISHKNIFF